MLKEKQITVMIKEPGEQPRLELLFDNELEAFADGNGVCG